MKFSFRHLAFGGVTRTRFHQTEAGYFSNFWLSLRWNIQRRAAAEAKFRCLRTKCPNLGQNCHNEACHIFWPFVRTLRDTWYHPYFGTSGTVTCDRRIDRNCTIVFLAEKGVGAWGEGRTCRVRSAAKTYKFWVALFGYASVLHLTTAPPPQKALVHFPSIIYITVSLMDGAR